MDTPRQNGFSESLKSFEHIGKVLYRLFKSELPIIEKVQITFITDPTKVQAMYPKALEEYEARDAKARGLKDEEVDKFYAASFASLLLQATFVLSLLNVIQTVVLSAGLTVAPQHKLTRRDLFSLLREVS